uniref:Uncharacterized protein n=1 Tax=Romanomermis culicivorax TaxID=13658 RepID=A0A915J6P6_ROMCU
MYKLTKKFWNEGQTPRNSEQDKHYTSKHSENSQLLQPDPRKKKPWLATALARLPAQKTQ